MSALRGSFVEWVPWAAAGDRGHALRRALRDGFVTPFAWTTDILAVGLRVSFDGVTNYGHGQAVQDHSESAMLQRGPN